MTPEEIRAYPTTSYNAQRAKVSDGKSVRVTVPQNTSIEAGQLCFLDGFLGFAMQSVTTAAGETSEIVLNIEQAEYECSQVDAADAFNKGDACYWDDGNKRLTTVQEAGMRYTGRVTSAKDAGGVIWLELAPQIPPDGDPDGEPKAAAVADVAAADAPAQGEAYVQADVQGIAALANANKAQLNALMAALRAAGILAAN